MRRMDPTASRPRSTSTILSTMAMSSLLNKSRHTTSILARAHVTHTKTRAKSRHNEKAAASTAYGSSERIATTRCCYEGMGPHGWSPLVVLVAGLLNSDCPVCERLSSCAAGTTASHCRRGATRSSLQLCSGGAHSSLRFQSNGEPAIDPILSKRPVLPTGLIAWSPVIDVRAAAPPCFGWCAYCSCSPANDLSVLSPTTTSSS